MSYKIGQFKRTQMGVSEFETIVSSVQVSGTTIKANFLEGQIYHLTALVTSSNQIKIKLQNNENDFQIIKILTSGNKKVDIIFMPIRDFKNIVLEGASSISSSSVELKQMTNILTYPSGIHKDKLMQIGIQGPEGLVFAINGSQMRLGKSGIFMSEEMEITSLCFVADTSKKTTDLYGDILQTDEDPFFIVDYQY